MQPDGWDSPAWWHLRPAPMPAGLMSAGEGCNASCMGARLHVQKLLGGVHPWMYITTFLGHPEMLPCNFVNVRRLHSMGHASISGTRGAVRST